MPMDTPSPAQTVKAPHDALTDRGVVPGGLADILEAVERRPTTASYLETVKRVEHLRDQLRPVRVALLATFTISPLVPFLKVEAARQGFAADVYVGPFDGTQQELLSPTSQCVQHRPDVVFVAQLLEDLCPPLTRDFLALSARDVDGYIDEVISKIVASLTAFRQVSAARMVMHNFALPQVPLLGIHEPMSAASQTDAIWRLNRRLVEAVGTIPDAFVMDFNAAAAFVGHRQWYDDKMLHLARTPLSAQALPVLARRHATFLRALLSSPRKCLVLDLDDTLWGGVVAERGLEGIDLGFTFPGNVYRAFQTFLLQLHRRGVLLAISSKNNRADVDDVFDRHPDMVLAREHFSAVRINWRPKPENLAEIAAELNIGLDSLVFFDDNPAECALMRQSLPQVLTLQAPADATKSPQVLIDSAAFERVSLTQEDLQRGAMYQQQTRRQQARAAGTLDDFLRGLEMTATIRPLDQFAFPRVLDLLHKTNQFNLTTRRYSATELTAMAADPAHAVFSLQLADRFGDNGIVGVAIMRVVERVAQLDSLLLSCRVIGRTAETALLAFVAEWARKQGALVLEGEFVPTPKNAPAADFLRLHGFTKVAGNGRGDHWTLDLTGASTWQHHVRLVEPGTSHGAV